MVQEGTIKRQFLALVTARETPITTLNNYIFNCLGGGNQTFVPKIVFQYFQTVSLSSIFSGTVWGLVCQNLNFLSGQIIFNMATGHPELIRIIHDFQWIADSITTNIKKGPIIHLLQ